ncbi:hypothetical protein N7495_006753 [Penicillium taxi]|uniref:uncharacterized protein n=1 Tax=Penicillium taxi TaxID=168475 RepID=UPI002544E7D3|nr:uncharacterized protein N7495_006753 [Penicillium taxi]KAJ5895062.1 hypothetical protein N7495_006753 [Penicillium taxi]
MPAKPTKTEKLALIVTHLRSSGTCFTLKELEKKLPAIASINGIQVKEFIQALTDEGQLRVEKIGSGNWYWSFDSDEKLERERQLDRVKTEVEKTRKSFTDQEAALATETMRRQDEPDHADVDEQRQVLLDTKAEVQAELLRLQTAESQSGDSVSHKGVNQLRSDLVRFRQQAIQWTDNLHILEQYMNKLTGDRQAVDAVLRDCYGDEYVDGEGLRELY